MITVAFKENENIKSNVQGLWQYSYGQVLRIQGLNLPTAVEIHFSLSNAGGEAVTRIGATKDGVTDVVIPDSMLENDGAEEDYDIYAFIYLTDSTSGETIKKISMVVKSRPRPEAFDTPEDAELFREAIKEVNNAADRAETAETEAEKHASAASENAAKIAEDREKVEEMIATVSDIEQQVETVRNAAESAGNSAQAAEEAKNDAAEHADSAGTSAQEAAKSEENARQHAEKTEADKNKTSEDRAEVERLVATVSGVSEQVEAIKEYKDQAQSAATNALLSENESEKAKEDALLAQAGAESAADEAERHALDVAGDKTEVERLAAQVREDKEAVEQSKTSVEETAQGFDQTVQQAKESINTVAAEKVSAVQNAGTQAVQEVTTVKGEAVKAVEDKSAEQERTLEQKGREIIESFPTAPDLDAKLDKQQGVENAGKALVIGEDGNVVPGEVQSGSNIEVDATLTQQGKAADAKATGDKILQFAIKNTATGKGTIQLKDSVEEKILDFKMQGQTSQETIENPNLFDLEKVLDINNWQERNTVRPSYSFEIKVESGYRYSFDADAVNWSVTNQYSIYFSVSEDSDAPFAVSYGKNDTHVSPTSKSNGKVYLILYEEITTALLTELFKNKLKNIQIRQGYSKLPYMLYAGGKKIPNPESSREIVSAGGKNKNLFDMRMVLNENGNINSNFSKAIEINSFNVVEGKKYLLITKGEVIETLNTYSSVYFGEEDLKYTNVETHALETTVGYKSFEEGNEKRIILQAKKTCSITRVMIHGNTNKNDYYKAEKFGLFEIGENEDAYSVEYKAYSDKNMIDIKVTGKNILNEEELYNSSVWNNYLYVVKLKPDTKYVFSRLGSTGYQSGIFFSIEDTKEGTASQIINSNSSAMNKNKVIFTTTDTGIIKFKLSGTSAGRLKEFIGYAQLEEGNVATEYEPYREQLITLTSDRSLTKWDKLEKRDSVWGWVYKTRTLNLADVETWGISDDSYTANLTHRVYADIADVVPHAECYSNKLYPFGSGDLREADYECVNVMNGQQLQIKLLKERGTTPEEVKAFFAESDIYVLYPSVNEEFVPLSDEEQDMLNNLHTYYPATVISNGEGCEMEVTYAADTTTYVNNKIAEIAAAALKGV